MRHKSELKITAILLSMAITASIFTPSAYAQNDSPEASGILPTPEPQIMSDEEWSAESYEGVYIDDANNSLAPVRAAKRNRTVNKHSEEEEPPVNIDNTSSLGNSIANYLGIELPEYSFLTYYEQQYEGYSIEDKLSDYFTEDEKEYISEMNSEEDSTDVLYCMLICMLDSENVDQPHKEEIIELIKDGYTVRSVLQGFIRLTILQELRESDITAIPAEDIDAENEEKVAETAKSAESENAEENSFDTEEINTDADEENEAVYETDISANDPIESEAEEADAETSQIAVSDDDEETDASEHALSSIKRYAVKQEEINHLNAVTATSSSTYQSLGTLHANEMLVEKQYTAVDGNVNIDKKSGNLRYERTDVSIPLKHNKSLDLKLVYDASQAKAAEYFQEESEHGLLYKGIACTVKQASLGVGWSFGITRKDTSYNIITLGDGRSFSVTASHTLQSCAYKDITYSYDSSSGYDIITYLDGTKEYLSGSRLVKKTDKYNNSIYYTYDTDDNLTSIYTDEDLGSIEITITYGDNYVTINRPDGSKVFYYLRDVTSEYGGKANCSWTLTNKQLASVKVQSGNTTLDSAYFFYELIEGDTISSHVPNGCYCYEYAVYYGLDVIENTTNGAMRYEYTILNNNFSEAGVSSYQMKVVSQKKKTNNSPNFVTMYTHTYSVKEGGSNSFHVRNTIVTSTGTDMQKTRTVYTDKDTTTYTYNTNSNGEYLISKNITQYPQYNMHTPYNSYTTMYNSNGDEMSSGYTYEYDNSDRITFTTEIFEGDIKRKTSYEYGLYNNITRMVISTGSGKKYYCIRRILTAAGDTKSIMEFGNWDGTDAIDYSHNLTKTEYEYDSDNNLIAEKRLNGSAILEHKKYEYSSGSPLPSQILYVDGSGNILEKTSYTYDVFGHVKSVTDGRGNTTNYIYDPLGRQKTVTDPNGNVTTCNFRDSYACYELVYSNNRGLLYVQNGFGSLVSLYEEEPDADVLISGAEYDVYERQTKACDAYNNETSITYDALGRQTSVTYPKITSSAPKPVRAEYFDVFFDSDNTKCSMYMQIDQTGRISCSFYDIYGRLYKTALVSNYSDFSSTNWDSVTSMPSNAQMVVTGTYTYDDLDLLTEEKDGENRPTSYTYDKLGNLLSQTQGTGTEAVSVSYEYDKANRMTKMTQNGKTTTYTYDFAGRLTEEKDPMNFTQTYNYDKAGCLTITLDKNGKFTLNTYNSRNLLVKTTKQGKVIKYTYDEMGNMLTCTNANGTISYEYNTDNTLSKVIYPDSKTIEYTSYDKNKRLLSMKDTFGNVTNYTYNARGQLASVSEKYSWSSSAKETVYSYNDDGMLSKTVIPNSMTTTRTYDYAGRVTYLNNTSNYSNSYSRHNYTYDNSGNIVSKTDNIRNTITNVTYTYDSVNRLKKEAYNGGASNNYTYDASNNLISAIGFGDKYYTYDNNNRLIKFVDEYASANTTEGVKGGIWETSYTYDNNGKLLSSDKKSNSYQSNQKTYSYDPWGNLTGYSDSLGETASYTYYADGLRQSKVTSGVTYKYYYNGDDLINDTKNGNRLNTYVMGADGYINREHGSSEDYYFKNLHGDVTFAFNSGKWRSSEYNYYAWGAFKTNYDYFSDANYIRYSGQFYDKESNLIYLRARYYDNEIMRFITEDPAKDGLNWYAYCGNNPVMFVDPSGMYDRTSAVEYARQWYNSTNTAQYERFDKEDLNIIESVAVSIINKVPGINLFGGDCANFVSQCLVAGGINMNSRWHYYLQTTYEWHTNNSMQITERDMTAAWSSAKAQYDFFSSDWAGYRNGDILQIWTIEGMKYNINYNNIQPGDLMYFANRQTQEVHHATMITKVDENGIYFSAHTKSRRDENLANNYLNSEMVFIVRIRDDAVNGYTD